MMTLIDAESGKVVKQEVDTLLDQLIIDKSTCLEYSNNETINSTNTTTLYLYKTHPVTLESEQVVDSTADEFAQLCVASNKKATELIASFHRQQALEVLCKHLMEKEMIEFRKELDLTKEIIDTLQQFVAEKMPLGVDSLIQKLAKTKCLPNECNYETLLDVLNAHYPRLAEQLKNDETEIRSKLEACKQYASIQGAAVATCEERLQALQEEIGTMSNSYQKLQAVQDILEQQTSLINSYQSLKMVNISNEVDVDLNSIDIMNNEIAIGEILRANNETLDEIQENFLIQTQKTLKMNTPQQIYGHLMKWKQRIVMCRTALARNTENKSYEEAMNRVLLVARLPDDYSESAVTEVMRRKQFHSQIDKEITTFYQSISLMVDAERKQRKGFRENMHKLPQSEISEAASKVFELIGLGEKYDELELASYSQFLLSKHHSLDLLTDNVVRDNDWEEIDDFDIRNEEVTVPMSPEQPQISIPEFGLESVFFNNAIDMMKVAEEKKSVTSDLISVDDNTSSSSTTPATPVDPIAEEIKSAPSAEILELETTLATVIEENEKLKRLLADQQCQMQTVISEFQNTHETLESEISMLSKSKKVLEEELKDTCDKFESTITQLTNAALERNMVYQEEKENLVSVVEQQQEALAKSKREAEFTCKLLDETKKELQRCRLVQEEQVSALTSKLELLSVENKTTQLLLEEERATTISLTQQVKALEEGTNALNLLVEDHNEEKLRHAEELNELLEQTKQQAAKESEQLKKALELAQAHSQSPSHSQYKDAELEAAQHKIKELQAIVQKSALMVNEYMTKASVVNKVRQDLAMNMTLCQRDVEQLDRRICSLREDMHEQSHLSLRGINIINQIGYMRMIIQAITDSILSSVSTVEEQTILAQHQQLIAYNNSIAEASNEVNDILLQLFQTGSESTLSFARPSDPSTVQVSLNNFQEDSKLLFFRSQKNREAFEAFNINNPGYYLSPDSVEVLKNRFGANYASTFYCVGKIVYMEPASSDVLRLNSAQPYTLVTVSFEE